MNQTMVNELLPPRTTQFIGKCQLRHPIDVVLCYMWLTWKLRLQEKNLISDDEFMMVSQKIWMIILCTWVRTLLFMTAAVRTRMRIHIYIWYQCNGMRYLNTKTPFLLRGHRTGLLTQPLPMRWDMCRSKAALWAIVKLRVTLKE